MIAVAEARARIVEALQRRGPCPAEEVSLSDAVGRVLAAPLAARLTQPPAAMSAMDGWAVRAADLESLPARLTQIGHLPAGQVFTQCVAPGQCVRIFTGAPLPPGTDSVVPQEECQAEAGQITVQAAGPAGSWVRRAGMDFSAGEILLETGRWLTPRDIGLAAAAGHVWFTVRRRPRIAILASGDEIVRPGDPVGRGQIVSSNAITLAAMIRHWGGEPVQLGIAGDTVDILAAMAGRAVGCDLLVTSGGASAGEHDLVRRALAEESTGSHLDFWKIAMRPGKPLMFGSHRGVPFLGLPGNPVAAMVCALLFLRPALRALQGQEPTEPARFARLTAALPANDRRADYLRGDLTPSADGLPRATAWPQQDSAMLRLFAAADCLIVRPPRAPPAARDDTVEIIELTGLV